MIGLASISPGLLFPDSMIECMRTGSASMWEGILGHLESNLNLSKYSLCLPRTIVGLSAGQSPHQLVEAQAVRQSRWTDETHQHTNGQITSTSTGLLV